jgi:hypothetical protein
MINLVLPIAAVASLALWIVLAFVVAIPSGWPHAFLGIGTTLVAAAIIKKGEQGTGKREE